VQVIFDPLADSIEHIRAGRLRALAVTTAARVAALPDVPTVGEFVPGYQATGWLGIGAPRGTPHEIVERLNREINAGLSDSGMKARFADLGYAPSTATSGDFAMFIAAETEKWARVVKFSGAKIQ
jgi:tripartite-type tricarboxylate transporter receptor subunit TctC